MVTASKLPARRQRILDFLREFMPVNGYSPTIREIQHSCAISSTSVVEYNLARLEEGGYLARRQDSARSIELLDGEGNPVSNNPRVAVVGSIAAGEPLPVFSAEEIPPVPEFDHSIEIRPALQRRFKALYALQVRGTSMIEDLIDDGDIVVIAPVTEVADGDQVVAWLRDEQEATLKKFYHHGDQWVRLQPANSQMRPMIHAADNVEVKGKVVEIQRQLG